ncbi:cytochrome d ubiquinol oxidase subunit II [Vreelandella sulfidaeris]|uniref:cytochrome d ubiquinol oxidase subunit II n=1 Tax=Vreelandella sulfidaeris TaxID=115553 RepID=UPI0035F0BF8A
MDNELFPIIWFGLISFALLIYILLDGYSLGIGILFPFIKDAEQRGIMITTASPFWDSNQTWLVLSVAGLYGAFPLVYSALLPALYLPLILMLMCLFFRGMTFEFRSKSSSYQWFDIGFGMTTTAVAFIQGMVVGSVVAGRVTSDGNFAENVFSGFSWFGLCTGLALVIGYALLGAAWLIIKTDGRLQSSFYRLIRPLMILFLLTIFAVFAMTPFVNELIAERWLQWPHLLAPVVTGLMMIALAILTIRSAARRDEKRIIVQIGMMFVLGLTGLLASFYRVMLPPDITLWEAASSRASQQFLLVGYMMTVPIILGYTTYTYRLFGGKVRESEA